MAIWLLCTVLVVHDVSFGAKVKYRGIAGEVCRLRSEMFVLHAIKTVIT